MGWWNHFSICSLSADPMWTTRCSGWRSLINVMETAVATAPWRTTAHRWDHKYIDGLIEENWFLGSISKFHWICESFSPLSIPNLLPRAEGHRVDMENLLLLLSDGSRLEGPRAIIAAIEKSVPPAPFCEFARLAWFAVPTNILFSVPRGNSGFSFDRTCHRTIIYFLFTEFRSLSFACFGCFIPFAKVEYLNFSQKYFHNFLSFTFSFFSYWIIFLNLFRCTVTVSLDLSTENSENHQTNHFRNPVAAVSFARHWRDETRRVLKSCLSFCSAHRKVRPHASNNTEGMKCWYSAIASTVWVGNGGGASRSARICIECGWGYCGWQCAEKDNKPTTEK